MTENNKNLPSWFTLVASIALVWNLLGLMSFVAHLMTSTEMLDATMPANEAALFKDYPMWATWSFGLAVISGSLGALALLLKKRLSLILFMLSFIAVIAQNYHAFVLVDSYAVYGAGSLTMPVLVLVIGGYLIWLSVKGSKEGWLK
ncbi:hypothetical protein [Neptunicella marina]|uniref:Sugar transporter n=1 Tax=Neptunicella marina TaxID=2125989 RepID=A0A8J6LZX9_9ALTE|nr:hypothetical protein [Neptunicella marina]MBC3764437.1 hypothetical protein [Neptunicella marina]